jgi:hypothetical protein
MAKQYRQKPSMDTFLRTIPNGKAVHVSIHNIAVSRIESSLTTDNAPIGPDSGVLCPCVLVTYQDGTTRLVVGDQTPFIGNYVRSEVQ